MKTCGRCQQSKPLEDFHKLKSSKDGRQSSCKMCACAATRKWYRDTLDERKEYEKSRANRAERAMHFMRLRRAKYPDKYKANTAVGNAIRDGRLFKEPCRVCGDPKVEAHHEDYDKPLDVIWLCRTHHRIHEGRSILLDTERYLGTVPNCSRRIAVFIIAPFQGAEWCSTHHGSVL